MDCGKRFNLVVISIIQVILVFMFVFLVTICALRLFSRGNMVSKDVNIHEYQFLSFNSKENTFSRGLVKNYEEIGKDEYQYHFKDEDHHLTSNFGSNEYVCSGSCFCSDDAQTIRRDSLTFLGRNLIYLVAAISSFVAIDKAKEFFKEECRNKFEESCPGQMILTKVDGCESPAKKEKRKEFDWMNNGQQKEGDDLRDFYCKGNCLPKYYLFSREAQEESYAFGCEDLKLEGPIKMDCSNFKTPEEINFAAINFFRSRAMNRFCLRMSLRRKFYRDKEIGMHQNVISYCVSGYRKWNPTIECRSM